MKRKNLDSMEAMLPICVSVFLSCHELFVVCCVSKVMLHQFASAFCSKAVFRWNDLPALENFRRYVANVFKGGLDVGVFSLANLRKLTFCSLSFTTPQKFPSFNRFTQLQRLSIFGNCEFGDCLLPATLIDLKLDIRGPWFPQQLPAGLKKFSLILHAQHMNFPANYFPKCLEHLAIEDDYHGAQQTTVDLCHLPDSLLCLSILRVTVVSYPQLSLPSGLRKLTLTNASILSFCFNKYKLPPTFRFHGPLKNNDTLSSNCCWQDVKITELYYSAWIKYLCAEQVTKLHVDFSFDLAPFCNVTSLTFIRWRNTEIGFNKIDQLMPSLTSLQKFVYDQDDMDYLRKSTSFLHLVRLDLMNSTDAIIDIQLPVLRFLKLWNLQVSTIIQISNSVTHFEWETSLSAIRDVTFLTRSKVERLLINQDIAGVFPLNLLPLSLHELVIKSFCHESDIIRKELHQIRPDIICYNLSCE